VTSEVDVVTRDVVVTDVSVVVVDPLVTTVVDVIVMGTVNVDVTVLTIRVHVEVGVGHTDFVVFAAVNVVHEAVLVVVVLGGGGVDTLVLVLPLGREVDVDALVVVVAGEDAVVDVVDETAPVVAALDGGAFVEEPAACRGRYCVVRVKETLFAGS